MFTPLSFSAVRQARRAFPVVSIRKARIGLGRSVLSLSMLLAGLALSALPVPAEEASATTLTGDGLLPTRSAHSVPESARRLQADIEGKGIMFFTAIDQADLGRGADIPLQLSQLLLFGNPPLGVLFLTSQPESGMDWPVRMLGHEDKDGVVRAVYQDCTWVAERYGIADRTAEFAKATEVVASIVASVADCAPISDCTR